MSPAVRVARALVRLYQVTLAGALGGQCRFHPTCSDYALDALAKYGFFKGAAKSIARVARCHPYNPGGYDPA